MHIPYKVTLKITSYIAEPYWTEKDDVISILKLSGSNRAKSEAKREQTLKAYLDKESITLAEYRDLVSRSNRQWYTNDDGVIIIPRHQLAGCLVQTLNTAPTSIRSKFTPDSFRHHVHISDFVTEKREKDGVFDRFVKRENSNQRSRTITEQITNFTAVGTVEVIDLFKVKQFTDLLDYALNETGVGASRKMGFGRGKVVECVETA